MNFAANGVKDFVDDDDWVIAAVISAAAILRKRRPITLVVFIEMAQRGSGVRVAVVGAGIVGLTTATMLQEELPGASITILADKFGTETTSDGAAGIFRPGLQFKGENEGDAR